MPEKSEEPSAGLPGVALQGTSISPGVVIGPVHLKDYDFGKVPNRRVPNERVEEELNRFHGALEASRRELQDLKSRMKGQLPVQEARIFDTHLAYLKDPIFVADVENLILNQQMNLEAAVGKVISDFDRIFKLVESEYLRERAVDLRDVAIRVLRNLGEPSGVSQTAAPSRYVLAVRELSMTDLFSLSGERVEAILTEEGGVTSHAAILARSLRLPTVIGIKGLLAAVKEGDLVLVDGAEGFVRVNPEESVRAEYGLGAEASAAEGEVDLGWVEKPALSRDGTPILLFASCNNLAEAEQAALFKMEGIGLYRTELPFVVDRNPPSEEQVLQVYARAAELSAPRPTVFRLLDLESSMRRPGAPGPSEPNPALGVKSLRLLFRDGGWLRTQIRAILRAGIGRDVRVLIPFVSGIDDVRRVKDALFEERWELRKGGLDLADRILVGASIEVPAAALLIRDIVREVDFLGIALDNLVQYTLAADRGNEGLREVFTRIHPAVLRVLRKLFEVGEGADLPVFVMGETAVQPEYLPFLLGVGARRFSIAPLAAASFKRALSELEIRECKRLAAEAARASSSADIELLYQRSQRE